MSKKRALHGHNANYDFKQAAPRKPMGNGSYSNMPELPIFATFSPEASYRGGIMNNPAMGVDMLSKVDENMKEPYGHD